MNFQHHCYLQSLHDFSLINIRICCTRNIIIIIINIIINNNQCWKSAFIFFQYFLMNVVERSKELHVFEIKLILCNTVHVSSKYL